MCWSILYVALCVILYVIFCLYVTLYVILCILYVDLKSSQATLMDLE